MVLIDLTVLSFIGFILQLRHPEKMADVEDIQPLVCDNGTGMVKVCYLQITVEINIY